ncbi:hypothetical protein SAMN02910369_02817 [Lachnospiraceae bacterium NE2001]|nr:hypothetical protein SAMN02910369_02817 [Lachnospiraceae bacterium NE2001]
MEEKKNKSLPLFVKILIGISILFAVLAVGIVLLVVCFIVGLKTELKNNTYDITVRVDEVQRDPDDGMYEIDHVTIISAEKKKESDNKPVVGDKLVLRHYLMHTSQDEVGDTIDLKIKDGEIVNVFTTWYQVYNE